MSCERPPRPFTAFVTSSSSLWAFDPPCTFAQILQKMGDRSGTEVRLLAKVLIFQDILVQNIHSVVVDVPFQG